MNLESKPVPFPLPMPKTNDGHLSVDSLSNQHWSLVEEYPPVFRLPHGAELSEAENVEIRFRAEDDSAVLFDTAAPYAPPPTSSMNKRHRMLLQLLNGELELRLSMGANGTKHVSGV